jgi:hypothetical protein
MAKRKLNTVFIISGGAGRVISAIPALEKYHRLNPNDDFKVLVHGWDSIFWSHPLLQDRTFEANQKGTFDLRIKDNKVCVPEPYNVHGFYNQKLNIIEAFDEEINKTDDHSDLNKINLYTSSMEKAEGQQAYQHLLQSSNKKKLIIFQPFGSGVQPSPTGPIDPSNRSMYPEDYLSLVRKISKDALILFVSNQEQRHPQDNITQPINPQAHYFRHLFALMENADYFLGIDSVGQYVAKAFNKPGLVMYGGTSEKNYGFPDHFRTVRKAERIPTYSPWRVSMEDTQFADRINDGIMKFSEDDLQEIADMVNNDLNLLFSNSKKDDNGGGMVYESNSARGCW